MKSHTEPATYPKGDRMICTTCGRPVADPYRRLLNGTIVEGCVSRAHDGAELSPASAAWHAAGRASTPGMISYGLVREADGERELEGRVS
jgi:hypothetical protein